MPEREHPLETRFKELGGKIKAAELAVKSGFDRLHKRPDYGSLTDETLEELHRLDHQTEISEALLTDGHWIHAMMMKGLSPDMIVDMWDTKEEIHSQFKEELNKGKDNL